MSDSGAWWAEPGGLCGPRLGSPTPSLNDCCRSVSSASGALPASLLSPGQRMMRSLCRYTMCTRSSQPFASPVRSRHAPLGVVGGSGLAGVTAAPAGGFCRLVAVFSSLPRRLDFSESLVCVGETLSEALRLGSVLGHLLDDWVRFQHRFRISVLFLYLTSLSLRLRPRRDQFFKGSYLVDPASSHMLVSKIKPCMSKYKLLYTVKLRMAH